MSRNTDRKGGGGGGVFMREDQEFSTWSLYVLRQSNQLSPMTIRMTAGSSLVTQEKLGIIG